MLVLVQASSYEASEWLARTGLFLPSSTMLGDPKGGASAEIDYICDVILLFFESNA